jgi:hypothetical protein
MQSACAWVSICCEAYGACCVAQRRIAEPPARRHVVVLPLTKRASLLFCVIVVKRVIRCTEVQLACLVGFNAGVCRRMALNKSYELDVKHDCTPDQTRRSKFHF